MDHQVAWTPQPGPQTAAITCPVPDIFFGGQRGGGKTDWLLGDYAEQASQYGKDAHGILFRRSMPELEEVVKRSRAIYGLIGWDYNEQKKTWSTPQGGTIKFRFLERDADAGLYQGHQYTWQGWDELTNWPAAEPVDELWATLRSAAGVPARRCSTGNPGGVGHHWVKARYITPAPPFTPFTWAPQPETHPHLTVQSIFIPSRLEDNILLMQNDPAYESRIAAATRGNPALWKAWRYGDWDVIAGAAFEEWNKDVHVSDTFSIPPNWDLFAGMDAGVRNPSWVGLIGRGPEGDTVVTHEWYWRNKDLKTAGEETGKTMRLIPPAHLPVGFDWHRLIIWGDSSMFSDSGIGGLTQATEFQEGLNTAFGGFEAAPALVSAATVKGPGSRRMGVALVRQMLHWEAGPDGEITPHNRPLLRVHARCKELIRTLPALPISRKDPEDVDTNAEDHPFDGLKMALLANPVPPPRQVRVQGNENKHPGLSPTGRRHRPKKPLSLTEWQQNQSGPGYTTGVRYNPATSPGDGE